MEIHNKWFERWASIYTDKGVSEGWEKAKLWAGRTIPPSLLPRLKKSIEEEFGKRDLAAEENECKCDCGNSHITSGESIRSGKSKSCGCNRKNPPNKENSII